MPTNQDGTGGTSTRRGPDKVTACQVVMGMLEGSGLRFQEQADELVITNPFDPQEGQVYVDYESGHVVYERTVLVSLGLLQGYEGAEADVEQGDEDEVGAEAILAALGGAPESAMALCDTPLMRRAGQAF